MLTMHHLWMTVPQTLILINQGLLPPNTSKLREINVFLAAQIITFSVNKNINKQTSKLV